MTIDHIKALQYSCNFIDDIVSNNMEDFLAKFHPTCRDNRCDLMFDSDTVWILSCYGDVHITYEQLREWMEGI